MKAQDQNRGRSVGIDVSDFGPIIRANVELRPLTVFVGPSNTGKSYLAVLIYALHRFFGGSDLLPRPWAGFRIFDDRSAFSQLPKRAAFDAEAFAAVREWMRAVSVTDDEAGMGSFYTLPDSVAVPVRSLFKELAELGPYLSSEIRRCFGVDRSEELIRRSGEDGTRVVLRTTVRPDNGRASLFRYFFEIEASREPRLATEIPDGAPLRIEDWRVLMRTTFYRLDEVMHDDMTKSDETAWVVRHTLAQLVNAVIPYTVGCFSRGAHYLPADRTGIMHAHRVVVGSLIERASHAGIRRDAPLPLLSGVLADFLDQLIRISDSSRHRRSGEHSSGLAKELERSVLNGSVLTKKSEVGYPSFSYRPAGWKDDLPLMSASSMVSELAPVVLFLRHVVRPGEVLIIEEPESHLHPAVQVKVAHLLAAVVRSGIRVVITTHSESVLEAIANLVGMSDLSEMDRKGIGGEDSALQPEDVGVWLFEPRNRSGGSVVKEIQLDRDSGTFPADYDEVTEALYNDWATIANRAEARRSR